MIQGLRRVVGHGMVAVATTLAVLAFSGPAQAATLINVVAAEAGAGAQVTFLSGTEFRLDSYYVEDRLCDGRAGLGWIQMDLGNGRTASTASWEEGRGCYNTSTWFNKFIYMDSKVYKLRVGTRACNNLGNLGGCSTTKYSIWLLNPKV